MCVGVCLRCGVCVHACVGSGMCSLRVCAHMCGMRCMYTCVHVHGVCMCVVCGVCVWFVGVCGL